MSTEKDVIRRIYGWPNRIFTYLVMRFMGFIYWPLFNRYLKWLEANQDKIMVLLRKKNPDLGKLYDLDKAIKAKLESTRISASQDSQKAEEAMDYWLDFISVLNHEMESGRMSAEQAAEILTMLPAQRQALLKKDERFSVYFNEQHPDMSLSEAQNFIDEELNRILEEQRKSAQSENTDQKKLLQELLQQPEKSTLKKVMRSIEDRIKAQKKIREMAEQKKKYDEYLKSLAAMNPELLEGIGSDSFKTEKQKELEKDKLLKKESVVLRKKLSEKAHLEKTLREIGSEKQKAIEEIQKDVGQNIKGSA